MNALSAVVTAVLSPLLFVALAAVGGVLLASGRRAAGGILLGATLAVLLALSIEPGRDLVVRPLEDRYPALDVSRRPAVEAVVILSAGAVDGSPDEAGRSALSPEAARRLLYGAGLSRQLGIPIVLSGGRAWQRVPGEEAEALVSKRVLLRLGIPESRILVEDKSRDTWGNARLSRAVLDQARVGAVALVTSAYHMPRAMLAFRRAGVKALAAPTDYRASREPYDPLSFAPSFHALVDSFEAIREYAGLAYYLLRR